MSEIDRRTSPRPRGGLGGPALGIGTAGLIACVLAGCTASTDGRTRSPSVVYEHERFGSPEIRTPQLGDR